MKIDALQFDSIMQLLAKISGQYVELDKKLDRELALIRQEAKETAEQLRREIKDTADQLRQEIKDTAEQRRQA